MRLASLKSGRDGRLVVVSSALTHCADASAIAPTLQTALDTWSRCEAPLRALAHRLERDGAGAEAFDETACASPLPRAYQWLDGSAYVNHVQLVRRARGAAMPETLWTEPLMYQGGSDGFLAPRDPIPASAHDVFGIDFEGEVAVIVGDVPMGAERDTALAAIRLVLLCNDISLRGLIPDELAKGFGFIQSKPASAFSPVAVTPDALGSAWREGKLHGVLAVDLNTRPFGRTDAGVDMTFDFGRLIGHAARTRILGAGTIIGSGTVSNHGPDGGPGRPIEAGGVGYACLAERRTVETLMDGAPRTPFLAPSDRVRITMSDATGQSLFGAIDQRVRL
jgi:fumarylacetoacetate (FAA) hydrolase